jgi:hypothetical protein
MQLFKLLNKYYHPELKQENKAYLLPTADKEKDTKVCSCPSPLFVL